MNGTVFFPFLGDTQRVINFIVTEDKAPASFKVNFLWFCNKRTQGPTYKARHNDWHRTTVLQRGRNGWALPFIVAHSVCLAKKIPHFPAKKSRLIFVRSRQSIIGGGRPSIKKAVMDFLSLSLFSPRHEGGKKLSLVRERIIGKVGGAVKREINF